MINSLRNSGNFIASQTEKKLSTTKATNAPSSFQNILFNITNNENVAVSSAEKNKSNFESWKSTYLTKGISKDHRAEVTEVSDLFKQVIDKAAASGGYDDPQTFINNLSPAELDALQHIHCLADPIIPQELSKEGALNLLYSPDQAKDINNDGILSTGLAAGWSYPPPNAPEAVKNAWKEATAGLSDMEVAMKMGPFMTAELSANFKPDGSGFYFPGEPGHRNIYAEPNFSYTKQVEDCLEMINKFKPSNYEEEKVLLQSFLGSLKKHQAA
ncbi:MAG: hypothetical protein Q8R88_06200 [Desulfoprunum sp.]|nr:hypothetical protein [Desulfoprunum sp.]